MIRLLAVAALVSAVMQARGGGSSLTGHVEGGGAPQGGYDYDGDGYSGDVDCDDSDPAIHPGAAERCNGRDDDCDGLTDESLGQSTCGVGGCQRTVDNCRNGAHQACVPGTPTPEICNRIDDDCDGLVDESYRRRGRDLDFACQDSDPFVGLATR